MPGSGDMPGISTCPISRPFSTPRQRPPALVRGWPGWRREAHYLAGRGRLGKREGCPHFRRSVWMCACASKSARAESRDGRSAAWPGAGAEPPGAARTGGRRAERRTAPESPRVCRMTLRRSKSPRQKRSGAERWRGVLPGRKWGLRATRRVPPFRCWVARRGDPVDNAPLGESASLTPRQTLRFNVRGNASGIKKNAPAFIS